MAIKIYGSPTAPIQGVLFDMDGVVLDTEKLYARFWAEGARALGYPMSYQQALGMRSLNSAAGQAKLESYFGPGIRIEQVRKIRIERMDAFIEEHGVEAKPGIHALLDGLKARGLRVAIATSSPMERAERYLRSVALWHRFDKICSGHEVPQGKPAPDIYLHAAACLGLPPENCLAIEDSQAGIQSAHAAGCKAVLVPDLDDFSEEICDHLYAKADSLTDILKLLSCRDA